MKHLPAIRRNHTAMARPMEHPFEVMHREMNELFGEFFRDFAPLTLPSMDRLWKGWGMVTPKFDVKETGKEYDITAELPGLEEKDVDLKIDHGMLVLKGEKKHEREEKKKGRFLSESSYRQYYRAFPLPREVDCERAKATFKKGVLRVTLPKDEKAKLEKKSIRILPE